MNVLRAGYFDGKRAIRDPYNIVRDFGTFAMHSRMPHEPDTAASAAHVPMRRLRAG